MAYGLANVHHVSKPSWMTCSVTGYKKQLLGTQGSTELSRWWVEVLVAFLSEPTIFLSQTSGWTGIKPPPPGLLPGAAVRLGRVPQFFESLCDRPNLLLSVFLGVNPCSVPRTERPQAFQRLLTGFVQQSGCGREHTHPSAGHLDGSRQLWIGVEGRCQFTGLDIRSGSPHGTYG